ncbi:ParB N-terminal domain-containing protein [Selenomonas ruminis]|uniref:ParB-like N-terminal domain-containing protein n=1 Tax=Selenomonas ruminis TaxID=2593411 RepID=A0A5D6VXJ8_9FIRM|nr:ParB N-terminal domain-containing protein [Selenomonas sp. mPRGC5]TYZ20207.1 hypothetical protein FZ040_12220 [Selenomonas sp. mPRGC5]
MKRYSGNILSILEKQRSVNAPAKDEAYEVQMIDAHDIVPNSKNFYGIRDVEELATRMKISGHITPLEVVANVDEPGKYTLISGERRRAAMLYRLEQGEIEKAVMPCIVRVDLNGTEELTAEEIETINIISANDYRDKTPFEKLDEVQKLEPIAKKLWEKETGSQGQFREYLCNKFLGISTSSLQRIKMMEHVVPEARKAYEENLLGKTALSELAYKSEDEQRAYIRDLESGNRSGTIADVQEKEMPQEEASDMACDEAAQDPMTAGQEDMEEALLQEIQAEKPGEAPRSLDMAEAEAKARQWVREGLLRLVEEATGKMEAAKARVDNADAALWDLRRAAANLAIEAMS